MALINISVQPGPFDARAETKALKALAGVGAIVTFSGICRGDGGRLAALELEHYPGMAEAEIHRIAGAAAMRWPVVGITVVHRFGTIAVGDEIVLVATASEHRHAAFEAAAFLMDYMKNNAPFWKREHLADGTTGDWISTHGRDDASEARWRVRKDGP